MHLHEELTDQCALTEYQDLRETVAEYEDAYKRAKSYIWDECFQKISESTWESSRPLLTNPYVKGYDSDTRCARILDSLDLLERKAFATAQSEIRKLTVDLYELLAETFMTEELQGRCPDWLPLDPCSQKALSLSPGSQPSVFPGPVRYADLMDSKGLIVNSKNRGDGRVPGKYCKERPMRNGREQLHGIGWWLQLGGFPDVNAIDIQGFSALDHAIDQAGWSPRAGLCALGLIDMTDPELINRPIRCLPKHRSGQPVGYTPLHLCCSGGISWYKTCIAQKLIEARADVNMPTEEWPYNTPAIMAASQGRKQLLEVLYEAGADKAAVNARGLGQLQGARQCSSTTKQFCLDEEVPDIKTLISGRTRGEHMNPSRVLRHAQKWAYDKRMLEERRLRETRDNGSEPRDSRDASQLSQDHGIFSFGQYDSWNRRAHDSFPSQDHRQRSFSHRNWKDEDRPRHSWEPWSSSGESAARKR